ncbi:MAG: aminodeoxychorismate/anthranilate synthase component II [Ruminococcus sp.]|nr:aminodeoxychorismate/anthranilate synthase component II [Oscillospiraceae bacterium]MDY4414276.1 aminodeoxychorismate/anthranilate synthase component II [Ruminococcus sp.]
MILLIDNFDSFSYNLYQLIGSINEDIKVIRNNDMTPEEIEKLNPSHIVISPGPGKPSEAGNCIEIIKALSGKYPIFGVCLGHQSIVEAFGGTVSYAKKLVHGKPEIIKINKNHPMFSGLDDTMQGARYHSLSALRENLPECLEVTAESSDGEIMAVAHKKYKIWGVQFHPESIMTPQGRELLVNFLK